MSDNTDRIKDRIRKLLALGDAEKNTFDAEIDNALRFARRLMLKHNIGEDDLKEEPRGAHEIAADVEATEYGKDWTRTMGSRFTAWECDLVGAVCALVGTVKWYRGHEETRRKRGTDIIEYNDVTGRPAKVRRIEIYGPAEDVRDALDLVAEWQETIVAMARMKHGGALRGAGKSYAEGFAFALKVKVAEMQKEELALIGNRNERLLALPSGEERSSALVVANATSLMVAKRERAEQWLEDVAGIKLCRGPGIGSGSHNSGAFGDGMKDGKKAGFSHRRTPKLGRGDS